MKVEKMKLTLITESPGIARVPTVTLIGSNAHSVVCTSSGAHGVLALVSHVARTTGSYVHCLLNFYLPSFFNGLSDCAELTITFYDRPVVGSRQLTADVRNNIFVPVFFVLCHSLSILVKTLAAVVTDYYRLLVTVE